MPSPIDIATWKRRDHFEFFRHYEQPFFEVCCPVDVTSLVCQCQDDPENSFFLASLFAALAAANDTEEFRYRFHGSGVGVYERIHAGSTVLTEDGTFRFAYIDYCEDFHEFRARATDVLRRIRQSPGRLMARRDRDDLIHFSILPWISFTSFTHARRVNHEDCIPKIVFGRYYEDSGKYLMPVSVALHHALADGLHAGNFLRGFQHWLDRVPGS